MSTSPTGDAATWAVQRLSGSLGGSVSGVDLDRLDDGEALRRLLFEHLVLVFPGQRLFKAAQVRVAGLLGTPAPAQDPTRTHLPPSLAVRRRRHLGQSGDSALRDRRLRRGRPEDAASDHCRLNPGRTKRRTERHGDRPLVAIR
jgi:alpha-ketoglutarate-dependent taurine dioxygenase